MCIGLKGLQGLGVKTFKHSKAILALSMPTEGLRLIGLSCLFCFRFSRLFRVCRVFRVFRVFLGLRSLMG